MAVTYGLGLPIGCSVLSEAPPDLYDPATDLANIRLYVDADHTTDSGAGTQVTAIQDLGPNAAHLALESSNGAILTAASGRVPKHLRFNNPGASDGNVYGSTEANLVALANGTAQDFSMLLAGQMMSSSVGYRMAWGTGSGGSTTRYMGVRYKNSGYVNQLLSRTATNNNAGTDETVLAHFGPTITWVTLDAAANTAIFRTDGIDAAPVAYTVGTAAVTKLTLGSFPQGSSHTDALKERLFARAAIAGKPTTQTKEDYETYMAPRLGIAWKGGFSTAATFGNGSNAWLIIVVAWAQSNACGRDPSLYAGNGANTGLYAMYQDGMVGTLQEPTCDATNGVNTADVGGGCSMFRKVGELLVAGGYAKNIMVVNVAKGSTTSSDWLSSIASNPPVVNGVAGYAFHAVDEAIKAPNSEVILVSEMGESNADPIGHAGADLVFHDEMNTGFTAFKTRYGAKMTRTKPIFMFQLPTTRMWTGSNSTVWGNVVAAAATLCNTTRSDCTLLARSNGSALLADNLHDTQATELANAATLAAAILSGT